MRRMCSTPVVGGGILLLVVQTSGNTSTRCWILLGMAERTTLLREVEREPVKTVASPRRTQAADGHKPPTDTSRQRIHRHLELAHKIDAQDRAVNLTLDEIKTNVVRTGIAVAEDQLESRLRTSGNSAAV